MGYNYSFFSFKNDRRLGFPVDHTGVTDADFATNLPWLEFKAWLIERGGRISPWDDDLVEMDYLNQGWIGFRGDNQSIGLDNHAPWNEVLDAFLALKALSDDVVLFHPQTGTFHDETSFRVMVDSTQS